MKKRNAASKFLGEIGLLIATVIMMIPVYYFVISSFKNRLDAFLHRLECEIVSSGNQRILILFVFCIGLPVTTSNLFYKFC